MTQPAKDRAASLRARLQMQARSRGDDFQQVLTRYANERLLVRLAQSSLKDQFVLKGATLFAAWLEHPYRATRDIDLLCTGRPNPANIERMFRELLAPHGDDGVLFDTKAMSVGPILGDHKYAGIRMQCFAFIANAKVRLQVDVGFGDSVTPPPVEIDYPTLLGMPRPRLRAYTRETVVAEKLEAMVHLGSANSRMKDFFDVAALARRFPFEGTSLALAIRATFEQRGTEIPRATPIAFTDAFGLDVGRIRQWSGFARKAGVRPVEDLVVVIAEVRRFAAEPLIAATDNAPWPSHWPAGGPWRTATAT